MNNDVYVLNVFNGALIAGATHHSGGVSANRIAKWNGTSWPRWRGLTMQCGPDRLHGELIAGAVSTRGWVSANRIAKWNGTSWAPLGSGGQQCARPDRLQRRTDRRGRFTTQRV